MGAYALGHCLPDSQSAALAVCHASYPLVGAGSTGPYVVTCAGLDEAGQLQLAVDGAAASAPAMTFASCEPGDEFREQGFTPDAVLYVTSWGVGVVLLLWSLGYAVSAAVGAIRKA